MEIKQISIGKLKNYKLNSKIHTEEQIQALAKAIKEYGFDQPIVIDKDNVIIKGHGRLYAAKRLGYKRVPCVVKDTLTPDQIKALRILDNKISQMTGFDDDMLALDIKDLNINLKDYNIDIDDLLEDAEEEIRDFNIDSFINESGDSLSETRQVSSGVDSSSDLVVSDTEESSDTEDSDWGERPEKKQSFFIEVYCSDFNEQLDVLNFLRSKGIAAVAK